MTAPKRLPTAPPPVTGLQRTPHGAFTVRRLHRSGASPARLLLIAPRSLLVGEDPRLGGVDDRIASRLAAELQRGVDLDVLSEPGPALAAIDRNPDFWRLWRYDALVVLLPSARNPLRGRGARLRSLMERTLPGAERTGPVLIVDAATGDRAASPADGRVVRVSVDGSGARLVDEVMPVLTGALRAARSGTGGGADDEQRRQRALASLGVHSAGVDRHLEDVVRLARDAFDAGSAAVNLITADELVVVAADGPSLRRMPREASLCSLSIERRGPTVLTDTWTVPSLRDHPMVNLPVGVRFYASHPLESIDGYRIGTLCICDRQPRHPDQVDLSLLRDFALLAEAELITGAR